MTQQDDITQRLNEIHADAGYLFGRVAADGACAGAMAESVRARIDAIKALLSQVRAPVADERTAFEKWTGYTEDALSRDAGDGYCIKGVDNQWRAWQARAALASTPAADKLPHWEEISAKLSRSETLTPLELFIHENEPGGDAAAPWRDQLDAALASAPVADVPLTHRCANCGAVFQGAGCPSCRLAAPVASAPVAEPGTMEEIHRQERERSPWVLPKDPTLPDSAPVAGEAKNYPGENVAERLDNMADDQPPGSQAQSDLYAAATIWRKHIAHRAAPQASEAVRTQVLAALESAQRFIRNGIEFGYIRMPDADTPDPAHRTPSLIDAAIRSLKTQADKDGGQWEPQTPEQIAADMRNMARSEGFDWPEPDGGQQCKRYVVLKASGSRYAYVNDTQEGRSINRFDVLKGDGWKYAHEFADRMNKEHERAALSASQAEQGERDA